MRVRAAAWDWQAEKDEMLRRYLERAELASISTAEAHTRSRDRVTRKSCRRTVKDELGDLPKWARGAAPGVLLLRPAEITSAAIKAKCRACGKCTKMGD